jgi:hypothetical protein
MTSPYSRRVFLAHGAQTLGAMPTFIASSWAYAIDTPSFARDESYKYLREQDLSILLILLPIALGVDLHVSRPADHRLLSQTLKALDHAMDKLSERHRSDLMLLLTLLSLPVTRIALGLCRPCKEASRDELSGFLGRWQKSMMGLKRFGYQTLMQLMEYAFYGVPSKVAYRG